MLLCSVLTLSFVFAHSQAYRWDAGILDELDFSRQKLAGAVNSSGTNYFPVVALDNRTLIFSRTGHPMNYGTRDLADIWMSFRGQGDNWSRAVNASSDINSSAANYLVGMHPSGNTYYVFTTDWAGERSYKLQSFTLRGRKWSGSEDMVIDSLDRLRELSSLTVSTNGEIMLMTAEGSNSVGGHDLYISFRKSKLNWSAPRNLSFELNTSRDERSVFLAPDGRTLYFSSDGYDGFGRQDLYISRRLDDTWEKWSAPINMGNEINSANDDMYFSLPARGQVAYFASYDEQNRQSIYQVQLPESLRPQSVQVFEGRIFGISPALLNSLNQNNYNPLLDELLHNREGTYVGIAAAGRSMNLFEGLEGYYPQLEYRHNEEEELDSDVYNLLAKIQGEQVDYFQRDAEIEMLQIRLNSLQEGLEAYRQEYKAALIALLQHEQEIELDLGDAIWQAVAAFPDTVPPTGQGRVDEQERARQLAELKKKFYQYYQPRAEEEDEDEYLWGEALGFEDFRTEVEAELKAELTPLVQYELKLKLYGEVREELADELNPELLAVLEDNEDNLREQIKQSFGYLSAPQEPEKTAAETAELADWQRRLKVELKDNLSGEVKEQLAGAMEGEVREALKKQMSFLAKQTEEEKWQSELDQKVAKQIKEEEEQGIDVEGLIPLSFSFQPADAEAATFEVVQKDVSLMPLEVGQVIRLSNVSFSPNAAMLKTKSYPELDRLAAFLKRNNQLKVQVSSHTNGWVSHAFAQELSQKRSEVLVQYLVEKGVGGNRLQAVGYGKKKPLASNETLEGRRRNQRVEFKILEH